MLPSKRKMAVLCALLTCSVLCACGKESDSEANMEQGVEVVGGNEIDLGEFADITQEELDSAIDAEDITREVFESMPLDEFRVVVAKNFPNYREIYQIKEDKVMTADDWQSVKYLMSYQLYGEFIYPEEEEVENEETEETEESEEAIESFDVEKEILDYFNNESQEENEEDEIDPEEETKKIIEELSLMSDDDFYAYVLYSMIENGIDVTEVTITPEELDEIRKQVIEEYSNKLSE